MQDGRKAVWSIPYVSVASFFPSWKHNFIAYRSSKVSDCIFKIHQQQLEYTLLKPDCHSWWISKMQSEFQKCNKIVLNLEKRPQKRMEGFRLLLEYLAWIEHQFFSGIRDSRKAGSLWGMMRGVGGVRKSIDQSWLAKRLGLLCWGFKGVQEKIPSEEASILQIGSVTFPPGQCTSLQLHSCHWLFDHDGHQDSSSASL